jgi:MFS family permease
MARLSDSELNHAALKPLHPDHEGESEPADLAPKNYPDQWMTSASLLRQDPETTADILLESFPALLSDATPGLNQLLEEGDQPTMSLAEQGEAESLLPEVRGIPVGGFLAVLQNQNFLKLWAGQVFSQLADKVYLVLMIALITTRYQSPDQTVSGWVSAIMVAFTIPAVLFGSVAGVYVDRWPKKQVLVWTNLLRGGLVILLPLLLWILEGWGAMGAISHGFWGLLVITFCVSTLTQFFAPAEQAAIPLIVERSQLLSANSLYTLTMMVAVILGFAAGDPLLSLADSVFSFLGHGFTWGRELVLGGCYAIAGVLLLFLSTGENTAALNPDPPHIWQDIRDGLRYLKHQKTVRAALIQLVILFSVFAALAVLVVRLAEILPEIKSSQFGFLLAAGGVGMAIGVFILGHWGQRLSHRQLSLIGALGMATSLAGLSVMTLHLWPSLIFLCSLGTFAALVGVPMQTTIQAETPEEMRGKIFGLQNNAVNIALSLPLALAGLAETFLGLPTVFMGLAAIVILGGLMTWYISQPSTSKIES